jgi:hypothetical protein
MILRATGRRVLAALGVGAVALSTLFAVPVGAAQQPPPGWIDQPDGTWVAFTLDGYPPSPDSRTSYAPVTVVRHSSNGDGSVGETWFSWHDVPDGAGGVIHQWLPVWDAGGIRMDRVDACEWTQTSCRYVIAPSSAGADFFFFGGTPLLDSGGQPNPNPANFAEGLIDLPPLPTIQPNIPPDPPTVDPDGSVTFDASGATDELEGSTPTLTFAWELVDSSGNQVDTGDQMTFTTTLPEYGEYTVNLTITAADGHAAVWTGALGYLEPPDSPPVDPPPSGGGGGGGTGGGGGGIPGIGFSNPVRRAPSSLTGGGGAAPTVVWLWRPEWYQSAPEPARQPETSGQPVIKERRDIVVSGPTPRGSNAGPWLAGVGIFGALGGSWLVSRRRRQRMLAEL